MSACPRCGAPLEALTGCAACGTVLEVRADATPFELLGLETLYDVDARELRKRHLRASRGVHPDFFGGAPVEVRAQAERNAALLNGALETLGDDARRADWLVQHLGGPDEIAERAMPQAFLMEVLEWNEVLEEARAAASFDARLAGLERDLRAQRTAALAAIARLLTPLPVPGAPALRTARQQLNVLRYVDRALADIEAQRLSKAAAN